MKARQGVAAVVDAHDEAVIWWVNIGAKPQATMSRLCGAWTIDRQDATTIESLVFNRIVVATHAGWHLLRESNIAADRSLDIDATLDAAVAERARCQAIFDTEQAGRPASKALRAPTWPELPDPIDINGPHSHTGGPDAPPEVNTALTVAKWLATLCARWEDLESERLARPWMAKIAGAHERLLPAVVRPRP